MFNSQHGMLRFLNVSSECDLTIRCSVTRNEDSPLEMPSNRGIDATKLRKWYNNRVQAGDL